MGIFFNQPRTPRVNTIHLNSNHGEWKAKPAVVKEASSLTLGTVRSLISECWCVAALERAVFAHGCLRGRDFIASIYFLGFSPPLLI